MKEELYNHMLLESNARNYSRHFATTFTKGDGCYLFDNRGKKYIDFLTSAGVHLLGHSNKRLVSKIKESLDSKLIFSSLDLITEERIAFIEELYSFLPERIIKNKKIHFCSPGGADAIEAASKLFCIATGRSGIVSFQGSYHGMTSLTLSLSGESQLKNKLSLSGLGGYVFPYPYLFRNPIGDSDTNPVEASLRYLEYSFSASTSGIPRPSMVVVELVQGEGGCIPAPDDWAIGLQQICKRYDVPLVVDEIQTGLGRTGRALACEWAGILPDAITLSKGLGGGFPISVLLHDKKYDIWNQGDHAGTYRGNQIAMVAGAETLRILREENILDSVIEKSNYFVGQLLILKEKFEIIGDVRGRGLMLGLEIVHPHSSEFLGLPQTNFKAASTIRDYCFKNGLIVELGGIDRSTIRFLPPLNVDSSILDDALNILGQALESIE